MNRAKESMTRSAGGRDGEVEVDLHTCPLHPGLSCSDPRLCGHRQTSSILTRAVLSLETRTARSRRPPRRPTSRSHGRCVLAKASRPVNSKSGGSLSLYLYVPPPARIRPLLTPRGSDRLGEPPGCREKAGPNDIRGLVSLRRRT